MEQPEDTNASQSKPVEVAGTVEVDSSSRFGGEKRSILDTGWKVQIERGKKEVVTHAGPSEHKKRIRSSWHLMVPMAVLMALLGYGAYNIWKANSDDSDLRENEENRPAAQDAQSKDASSDQDASPLADQGLGSNESDEDIDQEIEDNVSDYASEKCSDEHPDRCKQKTIEPVSDKTLPRSKVHKSDAVEKCAKGVMDACVDAGEELMEAEPITGKCREAKRFFETACEADHPKGCFKHGLIYDTEQCVSELRIPQEDRLAQIPKLWAKSCMLGYTWSCRNMGHIHLGLWLDLPKDSEEAISWFDRGCYPDRHTFIKSSEVTAQDDACEGLGDIYVNKATIGDLPEKRRSIRDAIDAYETGCSIYSGSESCVDLAYVYLTNEITISNPHYGLRLLETACAEDWMYPCDSFVRDLLNGRWLSPDVERANSFLDRACKESGLVEACLLQAKRFEQDPGAASTYYQSARETLTKMCSDPGPEQCLELGDVWILGKGGQRDVSTALESWETGCNADSDESCRRIIRVAGSKAEGVADPEMVRSALKQLAARRCLDKPHIWGCMMVIQTLLKSPSRLVDDAIFLRSVNHLVPLIPAETSAYWQIKALDTLRVAQRRIPFAWDENATIKRFCELGPEECDSRGSGCAEWLARSEDLCKNSANLRKRKTDRFRVSKDWSCPNNSDCWITVESLRRGIIDSQHVDIDGLDFLSCYQGYGCSFDGLHAFDRRGSGAWMGIDMEMLIKSRLEPCQEFGTCDDLKIVLKPSSSLPDADRAIENYGDWQRFDLEDGCGRYDMDACLELLQDHAMSRDLESFVATVAKSDCEDEAQSDSIRGRGCQVLAELWRGEAEAVAQRYYDLAERPLQRACDQFANSTLAGDECVNLFELHLSDRVKTADKSVWLAKLGEHCRVSDRGCDEFLHWKRKLKP